jgi:hypothetical protein
LKKEKSKQFFKEYPVIVVWFLPQKDLSLEVDQTRRKRKKIGNKSARVVQRCEEGEK